MLYKLSHEKSTLWYLGILTVLNFHCRPQQTPARNWLLGVDIENTSTVKAAQYQTLQHMVNHSANLWLPQPTHRAIGISCRMYLFQPQGLPEFRLVLSMQEKQAYAIRTLISAKNLIKAFIILGALSSVPTNLLIGMIPTCSLIVPWLLKVV